MKKTMLFLFAVMAIVFSLSVSAGTCTDTDGQYNYYGTNYYMKGTVDYQDLEIYGTGSFTDSCDGDTVIEGMCTTGTDGNPSYVQRSFSCTGGCSDGACIREAFPSEVRKIAFWYGKVNVHTQEGVWTTDPDGVAGAGTQSQWGSEGWSDRKLAYCQRFWPDTVDVEEAGEESIYGFMTRGNSKGPFVTVKMTYTCVQGNASGCSVINNACCTNGICETQQGTCVSGSKFRFLGCDSDCRPLSECIKDTEENTCCQITPVMPNAKSEYTFTAKTECETNVNCDGCPIRKVVPSSFCQQKEENVCCKIGAVVPNPVYSYSFMPKERCAPKCIVSEDGSKVCAVGASFEIVPSSFCQQKEEKVCCKVIPGVNPDSGSSIRKAPRYELRSMDNCGISCGSTSCDTFEVVADSFCESGTESVMPENCVKWFDGCNTCTIDTNRNMLCTNLGCVEMKPARCLEYSKTDVTDTVECKDSDGGFDYYKNGKVRYSIDLDAHSGQDECTNYDGTEATDTCSGDGCYVSEKYCSGEFTISAFIHKCAYGCENGACLKTKTETRTEHKVCCMMTPVTPEAVSKYVYVDSNACVDCRKLDDGTIGCTDGLKKEIVDDYLCAQYEKEQRDSGMLEGRSTGSAGSSDSVSSDSATLSEEGYAKGESPGFMRKVAIWFEENFGAGGGQDQAKTEE